MKQICYINPLIFTISMYHLVELLIGSWLVQWAELFNVRADLHIIENRVELFAHFLHSTIESNLEIEALDVFGEVKNTGIIPPFPKEKNTVNPKVILDQPFQDLFGQLVTNVLTQFGRMASGAITLAI